MATETKLKLKNSVVLSGVIKDIDLTKVVNGVSKRTGKTYTAISGTLSIDTGNGNIHSLRLYHGDKFGSGKDNPGFITLDRFIREMDAAKEAGNPDNPVIGQRIKVTPSFENNLFISNGELVKTYQIGGGFLETNPQRIGSDKAEFSVDAIISKDLIPEIRDEVETGRFFLDAEVANYSGMVYNVRFVIENKTGVDYINSLQKPCVLEIWGDVINTSIVRTKQTENAFGEAHVEETTFTTRENLIKGASTEVREMTEEMESAITAGRQLLNAAIAQREGEAKNAGGNAFSGTAQTPATPATSAKTDSFQF